MDIYKQNADVPQWDGHGRLPTGVEIEYRRRFWPAVDVWRKTRICYISHLTLIILDEDGNEEVYSNPNEIVFRPVGGLSESPHKEFLEGVVGVLEASSFEKFTLWKEYAHTKKITWKDSNGGPCLNIGNITKDKPVYVSMSILEANGKRLLVIDPTGTYVDWPMIDTWLEKHLPHSAFKENGFVNKSDAQNFFNLVHQ